MKALLFILSFSLLFPTRAERPPPGSVLEQINALGHEDFEIRREAYQKLEAWTKTYPRYLLLRMADAYQGNKDMEIITRLEELMEPVVVKWVLATPPGFIGINMGFKDLGQGRMAVEVGSVLDGHSAAQSGILPGDMITSIQGESITKLGSLEVFSDRVASLPPGTIIELGIVRGRKEIIMPLRLGARPDRPTASQVIKLQYEEWLRVLASKDADYDPTFPVGHFPLE